MNDYKRNEFRGDDFEGAMIDSVDNYWKFVKDRQSKD